MTALRFVGVFALVFLAVVPASSTAQQVLVDDPMSVPPGAAQLEAWHGREESWMTPAVRVHPLLETAVGTGFVRTGARPGRSVVHTVEGKVLLRPGSSHRLGAAVVVGGGAPRHEAAANRAETIYAYVPLSQTLLSGRVALYQNVGWHYAVLGSHVFTWGVRADWQIVDRFTLIGEVSGEGRSAPSGQLALRIALLPEHVEMDMSVTRVGLGSSPNTWGTVGLTFMSNPLF